MGASIRLLIADPVVGWRKLPMPKAMQVYRGESCLPEFANKTVVVAIAHLEVEGQKVVRLVRLERTEWPFDAGGRVDQNAVHAGLRMKMGDSVSGKRAGAGPMFSDADTRAICRVLGLGGA